MVKITPEKRNDIIKLLRGGWSYNNITKIVHSSKKTVTKINREANQSIRDFSKNRLLAKEKNREKLNHMVKSENIDQWKDILKLDIKKGSEKQIARKVSYQTRLIGVKYKYSKKYAPDERDILGVVTDIMSP